MLEKLDNKLIPAYVEKVAASLSRENIKDAYDSPNPYNGNKIWKDTFVDGSLDVIHEYKVAPEYNIPLFGTGIAMFYNKDMYKELGLEIEVHD